MPISLFTLVIQANPKSTSNSDPVSYSHLLTPILIHGVQKTAISLLSRRLNSELETL
jgi:hypothetical protein